LSAEIAGRDSTECREVGGRERESRKLTASRQQQQHGSGDEQGQDESGELTASLQLDLQVPLKDIMIVFCMLPPLETLGSDSKAFGILNEMFSAFDDEVRHFRMFKYHHVFNTYIVASPRAALRYSAYKHDVDENAAMLALAVRLKTIAAQFTAANGEPLWLSIGMDVGDMVGKIVGSERSFWCLFGKGINIAARLSYLASRDHLVYATSIALVTKEVAEKLKAVRAAIKTGKIKRAIKKSEKEKKNEVEKDKENGKRGGARDGQEAEQALQQGSQGQVGRSLLKKKLEKINSERTGEQGVERTIQELYTSASDAVETVHDSYTTEQDSYTRERTIQESLLRSEWGSEPTLRSEWSSFQSLQSLEQCPRHDLSGQAGQGKVLAGGKELRVLPPGKLFACQLLTLLLELVSFSTLLLMPHASMRFAHLTHLLI